MMFFMKAADGNDTPAIKGDLMSDRKKKREEKEKKRIEEQLRSDEKWSMVQRTIDGKAPRLDD